MTSHSYADDYLSLATDDIRMEQYEKAVGLMFIVVMAVAFLVNSALVVSFLFQRRYHKSHHAAYMNLAVADAAMALFGVTIRGPAIYTDHHTELECQMSLLAASYITMVNFASLVPLTYDRVIAALLPFRYKDLRHSRSLKIFFLLIWLTPVVIISLTVLTIHLAYGDVPIVSFNLTTRDCTLSSEWHSEYFKGVFMGTVYYILPLLFNIISYSIIIWRLSKRKNMRLAMLTLRAFLICFVFTVCWVPIFTFHLISTLGGEAISGIVWMAQVFMYTNVILDPLLYAFSLKALRPCLRTCYPSKVKVQATAPSSSRFAS